MNNTHFVFLLFYDKVAVTQKTRKESMYMDVYFHHLCKIHNFEILLEHKWTIDDNEFVPDDYDESIVVSDNSENKLDETIIDQKKCCRKKNIEDNLSAESFFVENKNNTKCRRDDDNK